MRLLFFRLRSAQTQAVGFHAAVAPPAPPITRGVYMRGLSCQLTPVVACTQRHLASLPPRTGPCTHGHIRRFFHGTWIRWCHCSAGMRKLNCRESSKLPFGRRTSNHCDLLTNSKLPTVGLSKVLKKKRVHPFECRWTIRAQIWILALGPLPLGLWMCAPPVEGGQAAVCKSAFQTRIGTKEHTLQSHIPIPLLRGWPTHFPRAQGSKPKTSP